MNTAQFIKALNLENPQGTDALEDIVNELHRIPSSYVALNWHSSHEYIYISQEVEEITGYPYKNFLNHGIMFIFTLTPPEMVDTISTTVTNQVSILEKNPRLILHPVHIDVDGGIMHKSGKLHRVRCVSTILDFLPGQQRTYLVLGNYISMDSAGPELQRLTDKARDLQLKLKDIYIKSNPGRFRVFNAYNLLTPRELEIADLICNGYNSRTIANKLSIALHTVTSHRKSLLKKMEAGNTAEMVQMLNQVS